jgi:O-antigen/teichoic acid export membrane protein
MVVDRIKNIYHHDGFRRYSANVSWTFISKIATSVLSFIVTIYVVRYLGPTNFGQLSYAISFVGIFSFIASLGVESILYRELVKSPQRSAELYGTSLLLRLLGSLLAFIAVMISVLIFDRPENYALIFIIALTFFVQPFSITSYYFQSRVETKKIIPIGFMIVVTLLLMKLILALTKANLILFALVYLIEPVLYALGYGWKYYKEGESFILWRYDKQLARQIFTDSWPLMFTGAFF